MFRIALIFVIFIVGRLAAGNDVLLSLDYSNLVSPVGSQGLATDATGASYVVLQGHPASPPIVTKLFPDGSAAWGIWPGYFVSLIAVNPAGDVYVAGSDLDNYPTVSRIDPTTLKTEQVKVGENLVLDALAVDSQGRAYVAGHTAPGVASFLETTDHALLKTPPPGGGSFLVRLQAGGVAVDYATWLPANIGATVALAVDGSGSAIVAGPGDVATPRLAKIASDGSATVYSNPVAGISQINAIASDLTGSVVLLEQQGTRLRVERYSPEGILLFGNNLLVRGSTWMHSLALDSTGAIYIAGGSIQNLPMKNSVATCGPLAGAAFLTVLDATGNLLQSTWIAGTSGISSASVVVSPNSFVYVLSSSPYRQAVLSRLSPHLNVKPVKLICVTDPVTWQAASIAPGKIVSLFGNGLGPLAGTQPKVTLASGFPTELANVKVTFDGKPAALLYVQDTQINAVAPWSLTPYTTTTVCVTYNGTPTNCFSGPVSPTAPTVFTDTAGYAAAINQDGTINSAAHPAKPGSWVSVFATGLGPISPPQADGAIVGLPLPVNQYPVGVTKCVPFGTPTCTPLSLAVQYAGPAPFELAGVTQINFQTSADSGPQTVQIQDYGDSNSFDLYMSSQ